MGGVAMQIKWSILIPAVVLVSLSGYYVTTSETQPQEVSVLSESPPQLQELALEEVIPPVQEEPEVAPPQTEEVEAVEETEEVVIEVPEEAPEEPEELIEEPIEVEEPGAPLEEELEEPELPEEEPEDPVEQEIPLEEEVEAIPAQPLDSDLYHLVGEYTSDQGVPVVIQFVDGFYQITLQGLTDSHHTIEDRTEAGSDTTALFITCASLPITIDLERAADGTLSVTVYMLDNPEPFMVATATPNAVGDI